MELSGEYCIAVYRYGKIKARLLCNKTQTSQITFPNGMKNKVYFNGIDMFIYCPIDKDKKIIITKSESINGNDGKLVMYNSGTRYNISKKDIVASD